MCEYCYRFHKYPSPPPSPVKKSKECMEDTIIVVDIIMDTEDQGLDDASEQLVE